MSEWQFITTEFTGGAGEAGERRIWEAVVQALSGVGQGLGFLNYRTFNISQQRRWEPDILLVSRDWGVLIVEVKSFTIEQLVDIQHPRWMMAPSFYKSYLEPYKQAERQLYQILKQCNRRESLKNVLSGRVLVGLPLITREEWRSRVVDEESPHFPPLLFADELGKVTLRRNLEQEGIVAQAGSQQPLTDEQWSQLRNVLLGPKLMPIARVTSDPPTGSGDRHQVLEKLRCWVVAEDRQQAAIGLQIPPGPQRIRGIAGSGKTLLLCQKAAQMHLQHPEWQIALVFFTRSLYDLIPQLVQTWYQHWSEAGKAINFEQSNLQILHAWGSAERPGFYKILRDQCGQTAMVREKPQGTYSERLAAACRRLLEGHSIVPLFDAVLIDEGQDLAVGADWNFEDKQSIYWLAWEALRPISSEQPKLRRLIWAYDEAQNLDAFGIPQYGEVFGQELGAYLSGSQSGPTYPGGSKKSEVMRRCYRTPGPILTAAHGIGLGLLRYGGPPEWLHHSNRLAQHWV